MAARKLAGLTLPGRAGTCNPRPPEAFAIFCPFDSLSITTTTIIPPLPPSTSTRHLFAHLHTRCHQPRKPGWTFSFRSGRGCCLKPRRLCRLTVCSRNKIFCTILHLKLQPRFSATNCSLAQHFYFHGLVFAPCRVSQHTPWTGRFHPPLPVPAAINPPDRAAIQDGKHHNRKHTSWPASLPSHTCPPCAVLGQTVSGRPPAQPTAAPGISWQCRFRPLALSPEPVKPLDAVRLIAAPPREPLARRLVAGVLLPAPAFA